VSSISSGISIGMEDFDERKHAKIEGLCYLKTVAERLKSYWAVILGKEIYFYRDRKDEKYRILHNLVGTFVKDLPPEVTNLGESHPIKIIFPPFKSRVIYFNNEEKKYKWLKILKELIGQKSFEDHFQIVKQLAQGTFGVVSLAI
jgi:hypothetical protein